MRQAGRYLPEYRKAREGVSFVDAVRDVERAVEISLQPLRLVGTEAVILFSDIFVPVLGMGVDLDFHPGPVIAAPIRTREQVESLRAADARTAVPYVFAILRRLRAALEDEAVPVIGFAGAPFTLAAYLVEGRGSKDFAALKRMMYREPAVLRALLERLTEMTVDYLNAQIAAGAQAVQLFDTWAGLLGADEYRAWVLPTHREIARRTARDQAPLILYVNGGAHVLDAMLDAGADVLSLDWRVDLAAAARHVGARASLQGNLDPCALAAPPEQIATWVRALAAAGRAARGHVLNLGHGCLPETPVDGVCAFTQAARTLA
jgi:uroporphyrinogen decarboxylase